eukprot:TRINITY_DN21479_c0_g1_i1.p1 TRINITY_DN21479_c0_g1~~TRINITY_DN21479_c0_g1_i1.p1  ORF type:complete len:854 (-),score=196.05 TRINITY_DN21479_c0_g1_i1:89-2650(-)
MPPLPELEKGRGRLLSAFRECFFKVAPPVGSGNWAATADIVCAIRMHPVLQVLLPSLENPLPTPLERTLRGLGDFGGGGVTWEAFEAYLVREKILEADLAASSGEQHDGLLAASGMMATSPAAAAFSGADPADGPRTDIADSAGTQTETAGAEGQPTVVPEEKPAMVEPEQAAVVPDEQALQAFRRRLQRLRQWLRTKFGDLAAVARQVEACDGIRPTKNSQRRPVRNSALQHFVQTAGASQTLWQDVAIVIAFLDQEESGFVDLVEVLDLSSSAGAAPADESSAGKPPAAEASSPAPAPVQPAEEASPAPAETFEAQVSVLAAAEKEQQRRQMLQLTDADWLKLGQRFGSLKQDGCDVISTVSFIEAVHKEHQDLLDRLVPRSSPSDRTTTFSQALEYLESKYVQTMRWDDFCAVMQQAPRCRRPLLSELMAEDLQAVAGPIAATDQGAMDPSKCPEVANKWMAEKLSVDHAMLLRFYERFLHCQRYGNMSAAVRRGDLVRSIQVCPALASDIAIQPICCARRGGAEGGESGEAASKVVRPLVWSQVLFDLERHQRIFLYWADVLEVVRWNRDRCVDAVADEDIGPSGYSWARGLPGPAKSVSVEKLEQARAASADARQAALPDVSGGSAPSRPIRHQVAGAEDFVEEGLADDVAAVAAALSRGVRGGPVGDVAAVGASLDRVAGIAADTYAGDGANVSAVGSAFSRAAASHGHGPIGLGTGQDREEESIRRHPFARDYDSEEEEIFARGGYRPATYASVLQHAAVPAPVTMAETPEKAAAPPRVAKREEKPLATPRTASVRVRLQGEYEDWWQSATAQPGRPSVCTEAMETEVARILGIPVGAVKFVKAAP